MFELAPDAATLRKATLRSASRDVLHVRQRFERALSNVEWMPSGFRAGAILLVRRLSIDSVEAITARFSFSDRVSTGLRRQAGRARRPWLHADASQAEAVLFADEAELVACLIRDWLRGLVGERWWWRSVLGDTSLSPWLRQNVLQRGEVLAPVIALLAKAGDAAAFAARIEAADCDRAMTALARSHAIAVPTAIDDVRPRSPLRPGGLEPAVEVDYDPPGEGLKPAVEIDYDPPGEGLERAVSRLLAEAPEVVQLPASEVSQRRLLALALLLTRAPTWTRTPQFARALLAIGRADAFEVARFRDIRKGKVQEPSNPEAAPEMAPEGASADTPVPQPVMPAPPVAQDRPIDSPEHERSRKSIANATAAHWTKDGSKFATQDGDRLPLGSPLASILSLHAHDAEAPIAPIIEKYPHLAATDAPAGLASLASMPQPAPSLLRAPALIATRFGGLFYLLNAALAMRIYSDFTAPRGENLELSPWDWLVMVGRAWFGDEIVDDPVWEVLADLAGRDPDEEPGRDFEPPSEEWFSGHLATLQARIALAIGPSEEADLAALVCRHEARIEITAGMVHVHLLLRELPLAIRIAGLDRDPGWIPAAGRDVRFHFA